MLPDKAIKEFSEIFLEETGTNLSEQEALVIATGLFNFFKTICRPIPAEQQNGKEMEHAKKNQGKHKHHAHSKRASGVSHHKARKKPYSCRITEEDVG